MAITKIEEVYLYVSDETDNPAENLQARAFMDHSEIPHTSLYYNDPSRFPEARRLILEAYAFADDPVEIPTLIRKIL